MVSIQVMISFQNGEVSAMLRQLRERTGNMRPVMAGIGQIVRSSVIRNFEAEGRPKWKSSIRAMKQGGKTLTDTARLRNSINVKAYADRVEVGTNVIYSAIHQFGGPAGRGRKVKIPARPFLMVQDEDWVEISAAVSDYLLKGIK